jgi:hypothetical protein
MCFIHSRCQFKQRLLCQIPHPAAAPYKIFMRRMLLTAYHNLLDHDGQSCIHSASLTPSPDPSGQHPRNTSSISTEVGIGHFDPTGVGESRQTISRLLVNPQSDDVEKAEKNPAFRFDYRRRTIPGPFDFEKCLRDIVKDSRCFYFMNTSD